MLPIDPICEKPDQLAPSPESSPRKRAEAETCVSAMGQMLNEASRSLAATLYCVVEEAKILLAYQDTAR
jgi:hypothetical protein